MKKPLDLANRMQARRLAQKLDDGWKRHTFTLPRQEARTQAAMLLREYLKAAYMTSVESWRELPGDQIEFTISPDADI